MNLLNLAHVIGQIVTDRSRCLDDEVEFRDTFSGVRNLGRSIQTPRHRASPAQTTGNKPSGAPAGQAYSQFVDLT